MTLIKAISLASVLALMACSHSDKKLDQALANTPEVEGPKAIQKEAAQRIKDDPNLTDAQRAQLTELRKSTKAQMDELQQESLKLRSLLLEAVLTENYNDLKVSAIKKRMKKVENQRLEATFKSVDRANQIFGRTSSIERRRELMYDIMVHPSEGIF